ncbi:prolipoprotein diacylglyceryl transferase [Kordia sp. YSTF-M3]|uniref:Phosphatidylglycerol--prolipoprotein diacylglyceryl transferase n=1 Tax=Kordia aestuariivivens TaxID=2759037 RepID=A0ABR7QC01_9FLAO|nr:prolipoprotein diacylglyceryl transferase [Kordia aestuariivivens]MBC8756095.1 prolipoprotein diacylglyceryl transferase [Kordia aestuariivivens]
MHLLSINWNPNEVLLNLGPIQIRYYSLMFIIAFSLGYYILKKMYEKENVPLEYLDSLFMYSVIATLLGARLGEVFFYNWAYYQDHLVEILLPIKEDPNATLLGFISGYKFTGFAGLASHGGAIGVIFAMYLHRRKHQYKSLLWILDRIVVPVAIGGAFVRLGNFFNSEIVGKYTNSDFGIVFQGRGDTLPRHPAQLYEALCYIILFVGLWYLFWKTNKKDKPGYLFGLFLVILWTIRFFVEFVKESQGGFEDKLGNILTTGQWLSIPFIIVGFYFMFRQTKEVTTDSVKS